MQKEIVLQKAEALFTQFGCKRVSMDDVANSLGISKKTIYVHFKNKRELVEQSVDYLLNRVRAEIDVYYNSKAFANKPFKRIEEIYRVGLKELRNLRPTFLYGLQKYYPEAYALFNNFRSEVVWTYVWELLMEAREKGQIRESINLKLVCELFLLRIDNIILPFSEFFENYSIDELLEHLVVVPLQGIQTKANKKPSNP